MLDDRKTSQKHAVLLKDRRVTYPLGQPMQNGNAQFGLDDDLEAVKPEPSEEEASAAARLSADGPIAIEDDEDVKPEDLKPRLDVRYTGFNIFGRTLVVMCVRSSLHRVSTDLLQQRGAVARTSGRHAHARTGSWSGTPPAHCHPRSSLFGQTRPLRLPCHSCSRANCSWTLPF